MARQLQTALSELALSPAVRLAGVYLSTDASPCIETFDSAVQDGTPFGLRIVVHASGQGLDDATHGPITLASDRIRGLEVGAANSMDRDAQVGLLSRCWGRQF